MRPILIASLLVLLGVSNGKPISHYDAGSLDTRDLGPLDKNWVEEIDSLKEDDKKEWKRADIAPPNKDEKYYEPEPDPEPVKKDWKRADIAPPKKDDQYEPKPAKKERKRADIVPPKKDDQYEPEPVKKEWKRADTAPPKHEPEPEPVKKEWKRADTKKDD